MKILRIIARLNVGGPARHVVFLTRDLQDGEFQSWLIAGSVPEGEEGMNYLAEQSGVTAIYVPEMSRELSPKDVVSLYKVYREIKRVQPDILHTHTAKAGAVGRSAGFLYRWLTVKAFVGRPRPLKVVHTFHGHVFHSYYGKFKTRIFITIERLLAKVATDKIVVISKQQFEEIYKTFGIGRAEQFEIIPLGIDLHAFQALADDNEFRSEIAAEKDDFLVGFVGRLTEIKNIPLLLNTARRLSLNGSKADSKLRFLIIGDGHLRRALEKQTAEMGLGSHVSFLGNREDVAHIYSALDAVALTSLNEGTPLSLIEAMAAGRPVISTSVGGVVDLLGSKCVEGDGFSVCERGIGTKSDSVDSFANGLTYLITNRDVRQEMASRGRDFALSRFSKDRLVYDMKELYRKLLQQG